MKTDYIQAVGITEEGKLYIKPEHEQFIMIWRSATEVHWNVQHKYLYSAKPREWSYLDWYKHIVTVIEEEAQCTLIVSNDTQWSNVPVELKSQIEAFSNLKFR